MDKREKKGILIEVEEGDFVIKAKDVPVVHDILNMYATGGINLGYSETAAKIVKQIEGKP